MKFTMVNGHLTIMLNEHIDSGNSNQVEAELLEILEKNPCEYLTLDAKDLRYISSSGLRVFLKLAKREQTGMRIKNVSLEIYEIFELTGLNRIINVEKLIRQLDVEGCPVIGKGAFGTVYRLNKDTVVKVYKGGEDSIPIIREETDKARKALISGVPTAIPFDTVRVGDQYGAVFEMIDAQNCNDIVANDRGALDELLVRYAGFLKNLHTIEDMSEELPSVRDVYLENLSGYAYCLREELYIRLKRLLEILPEDHHLIHGDVQLKNVMLSSGELMLIDMDKICTGNPVFEFASLFATYVAFNEDNPEDTLNFLGINKDDAFKIYHDTLQTYLGNPEDAVFKDADRKIRTAGYLRFLTILVLEWKDIQNPLKDIRIQHAVEHLENLAFQVEELSI